MKVFSNGLIIVSSLSLMSACSPKKFNSGDESFSQASFSSLAEPETEMINEQVGAESIPATNSQAICLTQYLDSSGNLFGGHFKYSGYTGGADGCITRCEQVAAMPTLSSRVDAVRCTYTNPAEPTSEFMFDIEL